MNLGNISNAVAGADASGTIVSSPTIVTNSHDSDRTQTNQTAKAPQKNPRIEEAKEMAEALNETLSDMGTNLGFTIREDMKNQVVVEVKNKTTDELIRQIPSEELLKIMEKMEELSGMIFDHRA